MNHIILLIVIMSLVNKQANCKKLVIMISRCFFVIATRNTFLFFIEVMIIFESYLIQEYNVIKIMLNINFLGNLGYSNVTKSEDRIYIEKKVKRAQYIIDSKLKDLKL